jgi:hypothetical protein
VVSKRQLKYANRKSSKNHERYSHERSENLFTLTKQLFHDDVKMALREIGGKDIRHFMRRLFEGDRKIDDWRRKPFDKSPDGLDSNGIV